jgi:hypothetical protein
VLRRVDGFVTPCKRKAMTRQLAILMAALVFAGILLAAVPGSPF